MAQSTTQMSIRIRNGVDEYGKNYGLLSSTPSTPLYSSHRDTLMTTVSQAIDATTRVRLDFNMSLLSFLRTSSFKSPFSISSFSFSDLESLSPESSSWGAARLMFAAYLVAATAPRRLLSGLSAYKIQNICIW